MTQTTKSLICDKFESTENSLGILNFFVVAVFKHAGFCRVYIHILLTLREAMAPI